MRYAGPEKSSEGETVKKQRRRKGKRAAGDLTVNIWPHIYTHTDTEEEDRKQGTLNTQWCFELRCMTSETESVSLSMLPETVYKKKDQNNLSMVENKHAEKQM